MRNDELIHHSSFRIHRSVEGRNVDMSTISAAAVKDLRDRTNAPMMECKAALTGRPPAATLVTQPFAGDPKKTVKDRIDDVIGIIRENMRLARGTQLTGLLGSYVHHDGSVGVLVQVEGEKADAQLLRDICM